LCKITKSPHTIRTSSDFDESDILDRQLIAPDSLELVLILILAIIPVLVHIRIPIRIKRRLPLGSSGRRRLQVVVSSSLGSSSPPSLALSGPAADERLGSVDEAFVDEIVEEEGAQCGGREGARRSVWEESGGTVVRGECHCVVRRNDYRDEYRSITADDRATTTTSSSSTDLISSRRDFQVPYLSSSRSDLEFNLDVT
jgi:hypothetical protein